MYHFDLNFNESLTNDIISFEQLGPVFECMWTEKATISLQNDVNMQV